MLWTPSGMSGALDAVPEHINHLFGLLLNPMTGRTEEMRLAAVSDHRHEIDDLLSAETVPPYKDDERWHKVFRKGGPLEWYNPPGGIHGPGIIELRRTAWERVA